MKQFDVVVIGSGFGGSVTALRLVEKDFSVGIYGLPYSARDEL
jgi:cholesterol oxidase